MKQGMFHQVLFSRELFFANLALERSDAFMNEFPVNSEARFSIKSLSTVLTVKTIFSGVMKNVGSKLGRLNEGFPTILADVRFLACVGPLVAI